MHWPRSRKRRYFENPINIGCFGFGSLRYSVLRTPSNLFLYYETQNPRPADLFGFTAFLAYLYWLRPTRS